MTSKDEEQNCMYVVVIRIGTYLFKFRTSFTIYDQLPKGGSYHFGGESQPGRRRVTYNQLLSLYEFLNKHKEIATGYNKSIQDREHSKKLWKKAATILNSLGEGAVRTGLEWSKYWVDIKAKIKRKDRLIRAAKSKTGSSSEQELTEIEHKFLQILEEGRSSPPRIEAVHLIEIHKTEDTEEYSSDHSSTEPFDRNPLPRQTATSSAPQHSDSSNPPTPAHRDTPPLQARWNRNLPPRRKRQKPRVLTAAQARQQLVSDSRAQARAAIANSRSMRRAVNILGELTTILRRIEARLPGTETPRRE